MLAISFVCADILAEEVLKEISDLRPGQFTLPGVRGRLLEAVRLAITSSFW
jgi:hypothetical protein